MIRIRSQAESQPRTRLETQFVYVVQCNDFVKIGAANNVVARMADLQVGCPYELRLLGYWRTAHPFQEEEAIHIYLDIYRVRGEWFRLPKEIMDRITMKLPAIDYARQLLPPERLALILDDLIQRNPDLSLS